MITNGEAIKDLMEAHDYIQKNVVLDDPSIALNITSYITKILILSCGSYYEIKLMPIVRVFVKNPELSFFRLFDFPKDNNLKCAKDFLAPFKNIFSKTFFQTIRKEVDDNTLLNQQMKDFQEICSMRNCFSHENLIIYDDFRNKTFYDIIHQHERAKCFLDYLISQF